MATAQNSTLQLSMDTSSRFTSLYCARGREVVGTLSVRMNDRRSERLWSQVEFLLDEIGLDIEDIELFSVCTGPGGFTGIRVGMAAAKGLAMAARRPLIGVTSLAAVAAAAVPAPAILAMTRANQGEGFSQLFRSDSSDVPAAEDSPVVSLPEEALARAGGRKHLTIIGEGASDNADLIERVGSSMCSGGRHGWVLGRCPEMLAPWVARVAEVRYSLGEPGNPHEVRATYVRPSEAETKLALGLVGPGLRR